MNFMRQKGQNQQNYKPINNYQKPQQFKPHQNISPNFNPQNASMQFNYNPQIPTNNQYKQNFFPPGPINIQNRPITTRYPTNNEVFGKKIESKPTPMSISTRNTNANYRPNFPRQQNVFQSNRPRNFKSEELFNINEGHNDSEPIQDDFEDRLVDYNEHLIEADKNDERNRMDCVKVERRKKNPRQTANIIEKITFLFTLPILRKGFKNDLEENDIYEIMPDFCATS
ncbi:hypothetical protein FQA39_LY10119 [Lamprigera yunnana]|nr:hypothetical protein FQA39_LY10119 [Lamprigera yunnana]